MLALRANGRVATHALTRDAKITLIGDRVSIIGIPYNSRSNLDALAIHNDW